MKKKKSNVIKNNYMYCIQCGSNPMISVDNAKKYMCSKCMPDNYEEILKLIKRRKL